MSKGYIAQIWLYAILSAIALALAFLLPATFSAVILGWVSALALIILLRVADPALYAPVYLIGFLSHLIAFYWLNNTIIEFGGFNPIVAGAIYLLFCSVSALKFLLLVFIYRRLPTIVDKLGLRTAWAWTVVEFLPLGIFPWALGHTQIRFFPFVQIADIAGAYLVSLVMLWTCESAWRLLALHEKNKALLAPIFIFFACIGYGLIRIPQFSFNENNSDIPIAIVQANISIEEKHNLKAFAQNVERYSALTQSLESNPLVIWPETVVQDWIATNVGNVTLDQRVPQFSGPLGYRPMLIGALTYEGNEKTFNSALAILPDGSIPAPYHKQILMPFGEYIPFGKFFPWLRKNILTIADFTAGTEIKVFDFPVCSTAGCQQIKTSPLICYEDIVPSISRQATKAGAQLLVNLTNDAWFGNSAAQYQHHIIASFRAIENRRFLVRSTNTGLSAVVSPNGKTLSYIKPFSEDIMLAKVKGLDYQSIYAYTLEDNLYWILVALSLIAILFKPKIN